MFVLDEEPDDDLDAHESEEHAQLELELFNSPSHVETGFILGRAETAWRAGRLTKKAFYDLLESSGQKEFWVKLLL